MMSAEEKGIFREMQSEDWQGNMREEILREEEQAAREDLYGRRGPGPTARRRRPDGADGAAPP